MSWQGVIHKYKEYLPVSDKTPIISLKEGNTPLISSKYLSDLIGLDVHLKYEGLNLLILKKTLGLCSAGEVAVFIKTSASPM